MELIKSGYSGDRIIRWDTKEGRNIERNPFAKAIMQYHELAVALGIQGTAWRMTAPMVWISNFNLDNGTAKFTESMQAILDRAGGSQVWFAANDEKLFQYTIWLATAGPMFRGSNIPLQVRTHVINWFNQHRNRTASLSPRSLFDLARDIGRVGLADTNRHHIESLHLKDMPVRDIPGFKRLELDLKKNRWVEVS
jgi:hypothetical protein